jgi:hypothetical protein
MTCKMLQYQYRIDNRLEFEMSNCIDFHESNKNLLFRKSQFKDFEAFKKIVLESNKSNLRPDAESDFDKYLSWWFINPTGFCDKGFVLKLGQHRSGHSWRDLEQISRFIGEHLKTPLTYTLKIFDDGFGWSKGAWSFPPKKD